MLSNCIFIFTAFISTKWKINFFKDPLIILYTENMNPHVQSGKILWYQKLKNNKCQ